MQTVQSLIQSRSQDKFSLTIDTFYYIHFFRKVNEKSQNQKNRNCKRPVKWSANRIANKAKQQEIANEVREKIIDSLNFRNLTGKRDRQQRKNVIRVDWTR